MPDAAQPYQKADAYAQFKAGDLRAALASQHDLNRLIDVLLGIGYGIGGWKSVLKELDIDPGYTVAPANAVTDERYAVLREKLAANGSLEKIG